MPEGPTAADVVALLVWATIILGTFTVLAAIAELIEWLGRDTTDEEETQHG